jgi:AcrR family transcriptional regulator
MDDPTPREMDGSPASARERILQSAAALFPGGRVRVTGVDALIAHADVAKATFYRHFPSKDDLVAAWLQSSQARWLDIVVSELESRGYTPLGRLIGFWEVMGEWAEGEQFRGCPYLNTLVEIRDPDHPAYSEVRSYIDEVETYLSRTALEAGIHDAPAVGRQLRVLAMGTWLAIVFEASTRPVVTARATAVALLAARLETTPDDVERRAFGR